MAKGKISYMIVKAPVNNKKFDALLHGLQSQKLVSSCTEAGYVIIARHQVNKTTLKKMLKKELA